MYLKHCDEHDEHDERCESCAEEQAREELATLHAAMRRKYGIGWRQETLPLEGFVEDEKKSRCEGDDRRARVRHVAQLLEDEKKSR